MNQIMSVLSGIPGPMQGLGALATGVGVVSVVLMFADPNRGPIYRAIFIGVVCVAIVLALYVLFNKLRDKSKGAKLGKFMARAGGGGADPALKARMDDLRKKFEEGVETFKKAGKDLYSLPWYVLAGPPGTGKTEAMRHCNVGFPPGLQDLLQGTGGTLNMNWWFTNHAVVLDTAGRMFMQEGGEGGTSEWKEFLKLLKVTRPHCPINGLLLVISAESLLKDSSEEIEKTAGAIARQLDVIQRTLDVRFPVTVLITKSDKIVGFREFFETLSDPALQHQILGWSNPAPLDETFKPDLVDKHLESVRSRLVKRRNGLLQNPVHSLDPNARRMDQVDELFELPDNLMRIAPRLRRYLEMIFVAGEWSPKPLFLRGIYFTSSMREGAVLDVTLAQALGVEVESIKSEAAMDKDRAYFLRDVFMGKVFKEKGLVTRATNVNNQIRKRRAVLLVSAMATVLLLGGFAWLGFRQYSTSMQPPTAFWKTAGLVYGNAERMTLVTDKTIDRNGKRVRIYEYKGSVPLGKRENDAGELVDDPIVDANDNEADAPRTPEGDVISSRGEFVITSGAWARTPIRVPAAFKIAAPMAGVNDDQFAAHKAFVETAVLQPVVAAAADKLRTETRWDDVSVKALAELTALRTYALDARPRSQTVSLSDIADAKKAAEDAKKAGAKGAADSAKAAGALLGGLPGKREIDLDALFMYVLRDPDDPNLTATQQQLYKRDAKGLADSLAAAMPDGLPGGLTAVVGAGSESFGEALGEAVGRFVGKLREGGFEQGSELEDLRRLADALDRFRLEEKKLQELALLKPGEGGAYPTPASKKDVDDLDAAVKASVGVMKQLDNEIAGAVTRVGDAQSVLNTLAQKGQDYRENVRAQFRLILDQLPRVADGDSSKVDAGLSRLARQVGEEAADADRSDGQPSAMKLVAGKVDELSRKVNAVAPMISTLRKAGSDATDRDYRVRFQAYEGMSAELSAAQTSPAEPADKPKALSARLAEAFARIEREQKDIAELAKFDAVEAGNLNAKDDRKRALDTAVRIGAVAADRSRFSTADQYIEDLRAGGITDRNGVQERIGRIAQTRADQGEEGFTESLRRPNLPFANSGDDVFDRRFHPRAAAELLNDYVQIRALVEGESRNDPRPFFGRNELDRDRRYGSLKGPIDDYINQYIAYWRDAVLSPGSPTIQTWEEARSGAARLPSILDELDGLKRIVKTDDGRGAFDIVGPAFKVLGADQKRERALKDVDDALSGLGRERFERTISDQAGRWRALMNKPSADEARKDLLAVAGRGQAKATYFDGYEPDGTPRIKWWNDFVLAAMDRMINDTQADVKGGIAGALRTLSGPPVAWGGSGPEVNPDELQNLLRRLGVEQAPAAAADAGAKREDLHPDIEARLRDLRGDNALSDAERELVQKLKPLVDTLAGGATLVIRPDRATNQSVNNNNTYALVVMNGDVAQRRTFRCDGTVQNFADREADMSIPVPLPAGSTTEIRFYPNDPAGAAARNSAAATLSIGDRWSLLSQMVKDGSAQYDTTLNPPAWRVTFQTSGGPFPAILEVRPRGMGKAPLPDHKAWPKAAEWRK